MKRFAISLVLIAMLGGMGQVFAQEDNLLGLYFDPFGDLDCIEAGTLSPYTPISLYLILQNPTFEVLGGLEFGMEIEGPAMVTNWAYPNGFQGFNFGSDGQFMIGFQGPMPIVESNILMTFHLFYIGTSHEGVCITLSGYEPSSLDPLYPTFVDSVGVMVSGAVNNGIDGACTARISETPCGVVATDSHSWDSLKSMYR